MYFTLHHLSFQKFDPNAISAHNSAGAKVGNVSAQQAARLAPLLDQYPSIQSKAIIAGPHSDSIPIKVSFFAAHSAAEMSFGGLKRLLGSFFQSAPGTDRYANKPAPVQLQPLTLNTVSTTAGDTELTVFGTSDMTLVGMKFHSGFRDITIGDSVKLVREPGNPYDSNAVRVDTMSGTTVGHIQRAQAKQLSGVMDLYEAVQFTATITGAERFSAIPLEVRYSTVANEAPLYKGIFKSRLKSLFNFMADDLTGADVWGAYREPNSQASVTSAAPALETVTFGSGTFTLVGMKYHAGYQDVNVGDSVNLVREPNNRYDKFAVRADTMNGITVGHIERTQAKSLSFIMDRLQAVKYAATISGAQRYSSLPVKVAFHCAPGVVLSCRNVLRLKLRGLFVEDGTISAQSTTSTSNGYTAPPIQSRAIEAKVQSRTMDWSGQREEIDKMFEKQTESRLRDLPIYEPPALLSHISFYDYQKQGVAWLTEQEKGSTPSYIKKAEEYGQRVWRCAITDTVFHEEPKPIRGALLADDMVLGKSLQTLCLILNNPPEGHVSYPIPAQNHGLGASGRPRTTLIVSPVSVMAAWQLQVDQHVNRYTENNLSVLLYHGDGRHAVLSAIEKGEVDIVLTSYGTLVSDLKAMKGAKGESTNASKGDGDDDFIPEVPKKRSKKKQKTERWIFDLRFHRVVLDEAVGLVNEKSTCKASPGLTRIVLSSQSLASDQEQQIGHF